MFETKTGLRKIATLITIAALAFAATTPASAAVKYQSTVRFIASKFVNHEYVEGFTAGKPDFGFTIESMLQLRAAGQNAKSLSAAVAYNLQSATNEGTQTNPVGLLYVDKKFQTGRGGMFLFASKAFDLGKSALRTAVLNSVKANIKPTGEITDAFGNTFTYGWTVLGLQASGETKLAALVANKLASIARPDGGFGTDQTGDTMTSAADATGMALMAFAATNKSNSATAKKAITWLSKTALVKDHFEAWGDVDVNGTAYAVMGLAAAGQKTASLQAWLASRLASTGGLTTPWSEGKADTYATAQGYIALLGSSYVSLNK
jgi:hypothetical protein